MLDAAAVEFFASLAAQSEEGLIVEDEEDLAAVARLVPMLCEVVARTAPEAEARSAQAQVEAVLRQVLTV